MSADKDTKDAEHELSTAEGTEGEPDNKQIRLLRDAYAKLKIVEAKTRELRDALSQFPQPLALRISK